MLKFIFTMIVLASSLGAQPTAPEEPEEPKGANGPSENIEVKF